jgi:hypothetical protein
VPDGGSPELMVRKLPPDRRSNRADPAIVGAVATDVGAVDDEVMSLRSRHTAGCCAVDFEGRMDDQLVVTVLEIVGTPAAHRDVEVRDVARTAVEGR